MLFLRRIKKVYFNSKIQQVSLEKAINEEIVEAVSLLRNGEQLSSWYVKTWIHNIPTNIQEELKSDSKTPRKIQNMEKTEISFALELNSTYDEIQALASNNSPLYSYLPTSVREFNFPFIVNCNFLLDAGRERIHKDRKWNEWLFEAIGYKTVECCYELASKNLFSSSYLSLLRNGYYGSPDKLRQKVNEGLKKGFERHPIIKNSAAELCKLAEIYFDPYHINQAVPVLIDKVADFLNEKNPQPAVKKDNIILLSAENIVLQQFGVRELNESLLQDFCITSHFRKIITIENNASILQFLRPFEENDPAGKWYTTMTNYPMIINQDNQLDFIKGVCFPIKINNLSEEYKNRLIHEQVYAHIEQSEVLIKWLEKLGVTEPGSIAYLEKEIIGRISTCISEENYLSLTKFILNLHKSGKLENHHYTELQELPLKTNYGFKKANQCVLSEVFSPIINFSKVLNTVYSISDNYLKIASAQECRQFFKLLNVIDDIDFIKSQKKLAPELPTSYVNQAYNFSKDGHKYPHLVGIFHPNSPNSNIPFYLQTFSFFDEIKSHTVAELFWERLFEKFQLKKDRTGTLGDIYEKSKPFTDYNLGNNHLLRTLDYMAWGYFENNRVYTLSYFFWELENSKCMPTLCGMQLAKDTFINTEYCRELAGNFLPIIKLKNLVSEDWSNLLNLKTRFSVNDLFTILEKITDLVNSKGTLDKENEKRLGLVYQELLIRLDTNQENIEEKIQDWAKNHRIISSSKKSIKPQDLLWVKLSGFENLAAGIETILLPKNIDTKHHMFEPLLQALGVKIVEDYNYQADNQREFYDLKVKLLKLITPIGLLLQNRLHISNLDRYIYEKSQDIAKIKFIRCSNIRPVFKYESEDIDGEPVPYYYDKKNHQFLISIDWKNHVSLLQLSYDLSRLLSATRLEKEFMMFLSFSESQIQDVLESYSLENTEYQSYKSYTDLLQLIVEIEPPINPIKIPENQSRSSNSVEEHGQLKTSNSSEEDNPEKDKNETFELTKEELRKLEHILGKELSEDQISNIWLIAAFRALQYFEEKGFDVSEAKKDFDSVVNRRMFENVIDNNGIKQRILVRSAKSRLLYLSFNAWSDLGVDNTSLLVITGNSKDDFILFDSQESIANHNSDSWLIKLDSPIDKSSILEELLDGEFAKNPDSYFSNLQFLIRLQGHDNKLDKIFNFNKQEDYTLDELQ